MNRWSGVVGVGLGCLLLSAVTVMGAPVAAPAPKVEAGTNKVEIPKSAFKFDKKAGRDPFFPRSARMQSRQQEDPGAVPAVSAELVKVLGITGPENARVALINNQAMKEGEEAEVRVDATHRVKVKLIKIQEDSVILQFPGMPGVTGEVTRKIDTTFLPISSGGE